LSELGLPHKVLTEKFGALSVVGANTAHHSGGNEQTIGLLGFQKIRCDLQIGIPSYRFSRHGTHILV
jgi:hypothetical protein